MVVTALEEVGVGTRLREVSFGVEAGSVLGVIGPNGAGKSTLLNCLAGIQRYEGEILLDRQPLERLAPRQRARRVGYLPQRCQSAWALSVRDVIALGRLPWADENAEAIADAARLAEVEDWLARPVDQLSGGEQARVWLARVLAGRPNLLLADEPAANLDLYHQHSVMRALRGYAGEGRAVLVSLHDLSLAARYCDRLCLLHHGRLHAWGTPEQVLTAQNLAEVFQVEAHIDLDATPPIVIPR